MANPKSLKPFQKGHDPRRNTKGRPVATWDSWKEAIEKELKKKVPTKYGVMTSEQAIIMKLIERAHSGHLPSMKILLNYSYGKPIYSCPNCSYEANRRARKELQEAELKEIERLEKIKIARAEIEVDRWIEGWFSKDSKKKRK